MLSNKVTIIDSGEAVARQTKAILKNNNLLNSNSKKGSHILYSNGAIIALEEILRTCNANYQVKELDF